MTKDSEDRPPLHDLLADLERHLISAYVAGAGHTFVTSSIFNRDQRSDTMRACPLRLPT